MFTRSLPHALGHRVNDPSRAARAELAGLDPCWSPEAEVAGKWWQIVVLLFFASSSSSSSFFVCVGFVENPAGIGSEGLLFL